MHRVTRHVSLGSGFESVAQEFVGPRRWKRIASGLPCPPSSGDRRTAETRESAPQTEAVGEVDVVATRDEPVDWDPEKDDCLNCAFRKSKLTLHPVSRNPDTLDALCHATLIFLILLLLVNAYSCPGPRLCSLSLTRVDALATAPATTNAPLCACSAGSS